MDWRHTLRQGVQRHPFITMQKMFVQREEIKSLEQYIPAVGFA